MDPLDWAIAGHVEGLDELGVRDVEGSDLHLVGEEARASVMTPSECAMNLARAVVFQREIVQAEIERSGHPSCQVWVRLEAWRTAVSN